MAKYNYTCGDCLYVQFCDADPSLRAFDRKNTAYCKGFKNAADVVEVVRCKDCRSYLEEEDGWCLEMDRSINPTDFCSYGEKRC